MKTYDDAVTDALVATEDLTALDRCDRCGARATHRVLFATGELLFCEHHRRQHADALSQVVQIPRSL